MDSKYLVSGDAVVLDEYCVKRFTCDSTAGRIPSDVYAVHYTVLSVSVMMSRGIEKPDAATQGEKSLPHCVEKYLTAAE